MGKGIAKGKVVKILLTFIALLGFYVMGHYILFLGERTQENLAWGIGCFIVALALGVQVANYERTDN